MWQAKVMEYTTPFGRNMSDMTRKLIWQRTLKGTMEDSDKAMARYNEHVDEVRAAVPQNRLLVFSVDRGWDPLCRFLDVAIPSRAFPNVNDRKEIKQRIAAMMWFAYLILALGAALAAALVYAAVRIAT
jgi:hypothetical protein